MDAAERRQFVNDHRVCIWGYERRNGPPSMSVVYYQMDGDDIILTTMRGRAKAKAIGRNPEISLCILDEQWPMTYLVVYGKGAIEEGADKGLDAFSAITEVMQGAPVTPEQREELRVMCEREDRVMVRFTPEGTFETPPRHIYQDTDISTVAHGLGNTLPWKS